MAHDTPTIDEPAGILNINTNEGIDFPLQLTWKDAGGLAQDLTGFTAKMHIRDQPNSYGALLLSLTTENTGLTLGGVLGTIDIRITQAQNIFGTSKNFYDLELSDGAGVSFKLLRGEFNSVAEVTA